MLKSKDEVEIGSLSPYLNQFFSNEAHKRPQNCDLHLRMLYLHITRGVQCSLLHTSCSNTSWKISFMQSARCFTHRSAGFNPMASCSEIWHQNSSFFAGNIVQFYDQKCFRVVFHCFQVFGVPRKRIAEKVVGSPWVDPEYIMGPREEWLWSMFADRLERVQIKETHWNSHSKFFLRSVCFMYGRKDLQHTVFT